MLYALGPLVFDVAPLNVHEADRSAEADFANKDLMGRRKGHEFVGEGDERINMRGRLFPEKLGGLAGLAMLDQMRASGAPQILVRGDGTKLGWFIVKRVSEQHGHLGRTGIGRQIEFDIDLLRDDAPSAANYVASLFSLLG